MLFRISFLLCLLTSAAIAQDRYDQVYDYYYQHGLQHYRDYLVEPEAQQAAAKYAQELAEYYASPAYQEALKTALPTTATPALRSAAANSLPSLRSLQLAEVGYDLIRHFEGLRLKPYRDAGGKFTIGHGHLLRKGETLNRITPAQANALLYKDVGIAEMMVKQQVKVPLSLSQFSALVVLVYNIGGDQFADSTLLRLINAGNHTAAAEEILRWEYASGKKLRGLARRRYAEYLLFTGKWRHASIPAQLIIALHAKASLYGAFTLEEARRIIERFEWHYTPKHGSWLT